MNSHHLPPAQGLYDPAREKDACGVGFVCDIGGRASHRLLGDALTVLKRLAHRGAVGADPRTGDGAGILLQVPHRFFEEKTASLAFSLPPPGHYGVGLVFLPAAAADREKCRRTMADILAAEGHLLLGWRKVPVNVSAIGDSARRSRPVIEQVFVAGPAAAAGGVDFERKLYIARRRIENAVAALELAGDSLFSISNLSARTLAYKGLLTPDQLDLFFPDLRDPAMQTALAVVHSRYSTNTFPSWTLAQPFRFLAHNGEINTLQGNVNWLRAREQRLQAAAFGPEIEKIKPVSPPGASDSATMDNFFELLVLSGRPLAHALLMLLPAAWENDRLLSRRQRDFYRYHACFCEPWDGPAAVAFTDGTSVGAALDRNGLRPVRYLVTRDGRVVMASEAGVLDIAPGDIVSSGRLGPGQLFLVDTGRGRVFGDGEIKEEIAARAPYGRWLRRNLLVLPTAGSPGDEPVGPATSDPEATAALAASFGYTREDLQSVLRPMAAEAAEPTGSMGNDTPLALFSRQPQLLFNYFKQLFAQVTNPAIDPIREELVMSLDTCLGPQENILAAGPGHCRRVYLRRPVLLEAQLRRLQSLGGAGFPSRTLSLLLEPGEAADFPAALKRLENEAAAAVATGCALLVLSDRGTAADRPALPSLLAVGAIHRCLVERGLRTRASLVVESAEPRETHHLALLFGYGADAVNPYLACRLIAGLAAEGQLALDAGAAIENYRCALEKGIKKIMSRMGISTLAGYRGAHIFECLGLAGEVTGRCFPGTPSRIGGAGFRELAAETAARHRLGYPGYPAPVSLPAGGRFAFRRDGEFHAWRPETITALQEAVRHNDRDRYLEFAELVNNQSGQLVTLRGALKFRPGPAVALSEVEPAADIVRRFVTGAMSYGSISSGAHHTLALAMNRLGGRSNSGEGGEDPRRCLPLPSGDSLRSAVRQVASGRFGVTAGYLANADEIQIKIAQGAKPGEGGQLPGHKVSAVIAEHRYTTPGVTLISPPPHHDIYSIEDLAQLIFDLKRANPRARVSVKLVSEIGVGTVAAGVAKGKADMILISGGDGGTGAAPLSSIFHAGLPWELGLAETHQALVLNDLRRRVRLQTDGQLRTGRDVAVAAALGAEEFGFASAALVVCGCVMLRHCHLNNCALGVATQNEILGKRFRGRPEHLVNYFRFVAEELRAIMSLAGVRKLDELVGRTDLLEVDRAVIPAKAGAVDFRGILYRPVPAPAKADRIVAGGGGRRLAVSALDRRLLVRCAAGLRERRPVRVAATITNTDRATGARLSYEVARRFGEQGLPEDTLSVDFRGTAGQSFGAWLAAGITFRLAGMANDYVGKGLSGGKLVIRPDEKFSGPAEDNVIIGNTAFYGATAGRAFVRGRAGERFAVRNSGLRAVVEGVGDHGCEYMTGGVVVVLGPTGRNFAAGMSGGRAYVHDPAGVFARRCNRDMVSLRRLGRADEKELVALLEQHLRLTASGPAARVLRDWAVEKSAFVKVLPRRGSRPPAARARDAGKAPGGGSDGR